jgi:hypothetical protein
MWRLQNLKSLKKSKTKQAGAAALCALRRDRRAHAMGSFESAGKKTESQSHYAEKIQQNSPIFKHFHPVSKLMHLSNF